MDIETLNSAQLSELITSLSNSMEDIRSHPVTVADEKDLPSNFEIMVRGINSADGIDTLFSSEMDTLISRMFEWVENGDYMKILENKEVIQSFTDAIFGKGSFQGPLSTSVLNNISATMQSYKYNSMKSHLGKSVTMLKKYNLLLKNLKRESKKYKDDKKMYEDYKEAIYAIKQVLKFAARIYYNRKLINKKVYNGVHHIVHEDTDYDEPLI